MNLDNDGTEYDPPSPRRRSKNLEFVNLDAKFDKSGTEEINVLSGKMDELMKLFATKSASIDPNDMPLSTLIENNN